MKRNITFSFDEELISRVLAIAASNRVSANELVRGFFENLASSGVDSEGVLNGNQKTLFDYSIGIIDRSEARKYLGVTDFVLSQMMRAAGFPPPRASVAEERAMVEGVRHIDLGS